MIDPQQVLTCLNFGRVDGESDHRFNTCFIGTEMLRQVLLPQHSLIVGNKGSGKSAICRLLSEDLQKVKPLLPKNYDEIYCIPAYGLQSEQFLPDVDLRELKPTSVDDFRDFWLLYLGLKTATTLLNDEKVTNAALKGKNVKLTEAYETLHVMLVDLGLREEKNPLKKMKLPFFSKNGGSAKKGSSRDNGNVSAATDFKHKTGMSIIALLDNIDIVLQETKSLAWLMLDKLDLLFVDDMVKLKSAITGLVQLLVQYGNQFRNIHLKIFLRNDIYRQLHIVNKSHLVSYSSDMKWPGHLLLKLLVARAVVDNHVRAYCEQMMGEKVDVSNVILGTDDYVKRIFYTIFEPTMGSSEINSTPTDQWILRRLVDGTGSSFPRELIHLGNRAVEKQREFNRQENRHCSTKLISGKALKEAFEMISAYRCDTYLYSEFPHLTKHFDIFRGSDTTVFHRQELYMLFEPLSPKGDDAIRAVYDTGLLMPLGNNVDSSRKFKVPLLYRSGLGVSERRHYSRPRGPRKQDHPPRQQQRTDVAPDEEHHSVEEEDMN
jgi:hypothetical protein